MEKRTPQRTCISCRAKGDKSNFIRIVKTADGNFFLDAAGKSDGRGAYVCNNSQCMAKMKKSRALDRSFHVFVSEEIYVRLIEEFNRIEE